MVSQQYIGALAILLVSVLKTLGYNIGNDTLVSILTGAVALWVAFRRFKQGDISLGGVRK